MMYGTELEQKFKTATDFATAADLAAERAILEVIRAARPGDGFVGEEFGEAGGIGPPTPAGICGRPASTPNRPAPRSSSPTSSGSRRASPR